MRPCIAWIRSLPSDYIPTLLLIVLCHVAAQLSYTEFARLACMEFAQNLLNNATTHMLIVVLLKHFLVLILLHVQSYSENLG